MSAKLTKKYHHEIAKTFKESISDKNYYLAIGATVTYPSNTTPRDTLTEENRNLSNVTAMKRIYSNDVELVAARRDWTNAETYAEWSNDDTNLINTDFYVYNNVNYSVYLCANNNADSISTFTPNTTGVTLQTTEDGYKWKYLYTIETSQRTKFVNSSWIPVLVNDTVSTASVSDEYGENAPQDLQANHVMINSRLQGSEFGKFPVVGANANINMICIVSDPKDDTTNAVGMQQAYNVSANELVSNSGDILYINYLADNIERSVLQTDNLQIVLEF